ELLSEQSIKASVVDVYILKPLNKESLLNEIKGVKKIVTLEEHLLNGGFGSIIAEMIVDEGLQISLKRCGVNDKYYYAYGGRENIQKLCGLDQDSIVKNIVSWLT
ncbi:transketolase C-terminal domain-containing protein, partial [Candidatus Omnitrophota bacterium]